MTIAEQLRHLADMSEQDPDDWSRIRWRLLVVLDNGDRADDRRHPGRCIDQMLGKEAAPVEDGLERG